MYIIMQTVFEDDEKIFNSILAGADGYILKKTPPEKLIEGIYDVVNGGAPMTATVARRVLELFQKQNFNLMKNLIYLNVNLKYCACW